MAGWHAISREDSEYQDDEDEHENNVSGAAVASHAIDRLRSALVVFGTVTIGVYIGMMFVLLRRALDLEGSVH
jgi:hypothetical protein